MNQAVVCIAPTVQEAEKEVNNLRAVGFKTDDISVLWPDVAGAQELGYEQNTKAPEGIAWGSAIGAVLGAAQFYMIATGGLYVPFAAEVANAGPLFGTLAGAAVGGIFGYLLGWAIGSAFPEYEAKKYERKIKVGSTLLAVHTDSIDEIKLAESALKKTDAFGIHHIEEAGRRNHKCALTGEKTVIKNATTLALLALMTLAGSAALADDNPAVAPSVAPTPASPTKIDASISPQAKIDEQKSSMPPDTTSLKSLNKDQTDNLNANNQVKIPTSLKTKTTQTTTESVKGKAAVPARTVTQTNTVKIKN